MIDLVIYLIIGIVCYHTIVTDEVKVEVEKHNDFAKFATIFIFVLVAPILLVFFLLKELFEK